MRVRTDTRATFERGSGPGAPREENRSFSTRSHGVGHNQCLLYFSTSCRDKQLYDAIFPLLFDTHASDALDAHSLTVEFAVLRIFAGRINAGRSA